MREAEVAEEGVKESREEKRGSGENERRRVRCRFLPVTAELQNRTQTMFPPL